MQRSAMQCNAKQILWIAGQKVILSSLMGPPVREELPSVQDGACGPHMTVSLLRLGLLWVSGRAEMAARAELLYMRARMVVHVGASFRVARTPRRSTRGARGQREAV